MYCLCISLNVNGSSSICFCSNVTSDFIPSQNDKDKLRDLINYHITTSSLEASDITNNHISDTRADLPLRVNLYSRVSTLPTSSTLPSLTFICIFLYVEAS